MDTDGPKDFFVSYTHADQRWAEWIAWHLEEAGYQTMLQAWDFLAGGNFVLDMDTAARKATRTIAVLPPDYFASQFTRAEWAAAFRHDPTGEQGLLLPVRVRSCDVEGLLGQIVYLDLVDQDEATARTTLLHGVKHERRKPSSPPVFPSATLHAPPSSARSSLYSKLRTSPLDTGLEQGYPCSIQLLDAPGKVSFLLTARPIRKARTSLALFLSGTDHERVALRAPQ